MADEAILRIILQDQGAIALQGAPTPPSQPTPPQPHQQTAAGAAATTILPVPLDAQPTAPLQPETIPTPPPQSTQPFDPYEEARRQHEREERRAQTREAYEDLYGAGVEIAPQERTGLEQVIDVVGPFRWMLAGLFGPAISALIGLARLPQQPSAARMPPPPAPAPPPPPAPAPPPPPAPAPAPSPESRARQTQLPPQQAADQPPAPPAPPAPPPAATPRTAADVTRGFNAPTSTQARGTAESAQAAEMAGVETDVTSGAGLAEAAGPIGAAIAAVLVFEAAVKGATKAVVGLVGGMAQAVADPSPDPSVAIGKLGSAASDASNKLTYISPALSILAGVVGDTITSFAGLMRSIDATVERYGEYSAQIAQAQAIAEIRQTMGDFRRAQEVSGEMAKYLIAQSDLQQRLEDVKVRLLNRLLPIVTRILEILEVILEFGDSGIKAFEILATPLTMIASAIDEIVGMQRDDRFPDPEDPTSVILGESTRKLVVPDE